jgi:hypothetical protein
MTDSEISAAEASTGSKTIADLLGDPDALDET